MNYSELDELLQLDEGPPDEATCCKSRALLPVLVASPSDLRGPAFGLLPRNRSASQGAADHPYVWIKSVQSRLVHRPISSESYIKKTPRERVACARAAPAAHHMKG
jgi:hypothetical protein